MSHFFLLKRQNAPVLPPGFEELSFHVPVDSSSLSLPLSLSLSLSGGQGWNGFLGKGSFRRHTSFHPNRRPRRKHNYPPSVHVCCSSSRRLMSVLRSWYERVCFHHYGNGEPQKPCLFIPVLVLFCSSFQR